MGAAIGGDLPAEDLQADEGPLGTPSRNKNASAALLRDGVRAGKPQKLSAAEIKNRWICRIPYLNARVPERINSAAA